MSHNVGRVVAIAPTRIGSDGPLAPVAPGVWEFGFVPQAALSGGDPRFVILHLTSLTLPGTSRVEVELGYGTDVITSAAGSEAWSRPIDSKLGPIVVRFVGAAGGVTLAEYGSGEPWTTTYPPEQDYLESTTNADPFLHTDSAGAGGALRRHAGDRPLGQHVGARHLRPWATSAERRATAAQLWGDERAALGDERLNSRPAVRQ